MIFCCVLFTSFYFCRLVPRLTTNLRRLALTYEGFEMVQNSSQAFLNLQTLANTCDTFGQKMQKFFMASFDGKRSP